MTLKSFQNISNITMQYQRREISWKCLYEQRREGIFCDVTLQCSNGQVSAHKCILATVSEYFKVLFTSPISTATSTNEVSFDDFSTEAVILLLDVIYSEADIPAAYVVELMRLADYVQMQWLVDALVEAIRQHIDETNIFEWYADAQEFGFFKLKFLCECYVRENRNKLQTERVECSFKCNVFDEVDIWNTDLTRELVVITTHKKRYFLIDPKLNSVKNLNSNIDPELPNSQELSKFCTVDKGLETSFVHQNIIHLVTRGKEIDRESSTYFIWKFQHTTRTYEMVSELKESELMDKFTDDDLWGFSVTQLFYDGHGSLYVLCIVPSHSFQSYYGLRSIFKFDFNNLVFYEGYVLGEGLGHMACLNDHGACMVTPNTIYCLEEHHFDDPGFRIDSLSKMVLNHHVVNGDQIQNVPTDSFDWGSWCPVNKEGQFYCLVDNDMMPDSVTLRLDVDQLSWILCDSPDSSTIDVQKEHDRPYRMFHCGSTLYRHWYVQKGKRHEISYLDEEKNVWKPVHFSPKKTYHRYIYSYAVVPYHILV